MNGLLATDLSPDWDKILVCAGEFKSLGCEQIILTHVIATNGITGAHRFFQQSSIPADDVTLVVVKFTE